jgi:site-specific DNA-methyltransferase (adenine-specific)
MRLTMTVERGKGWEMHLGDCLEVMATIEKVDHVITDPPYGEDVHSRVWSAKALGRPTEHASIDFPCLDAATRKAVSAHIARLASRWGLVFCDLEGIAAWRASAMDAGLDYVRACLWVKPDATPQFTGDRPASGAEALVAMHPPGKKRWNGGGKRNVYTATRAPGGSEHPTTKPVALMLALVEDFTDRDDLILDAFAGSGTTGVACLRLGRRFIGVERDPKYFALAVARLRAEEQQSTLQAQRAGQAPLFGVERP